MFQHPEQKSSSDSAKMQVIFFHKNSYQYISSFVQGLQLYIGKNHAGKKGKNIIMSKIFLAAVFIYWMTIFLGRRYYSLNRLGV